MDSSAAISISRVGYRYRERRALVDVSLEIAAGEIFAFLGPNGGGKTTLFRLLSTLVPMQEGSIKILDLDVARQAQEVRRRIGVVFQAPSLDRKLSVSENLWQHGQLYGITGATFAQRRGEMLARFGLSDRASDRVETLSGGLRRRVELANGLLHRPRVLLLDEPSTGLDPGARSDLWEYLHRVRDEEGVTVVLTTHLLEEAEKADRLAIIERWPARRTRYARTAARHRGRRYDLDRSGRAGRVGGGHFRAARLPGHRGRRPRAIGKTRRPSMGGPPGGRISRADPFDHGGQANVGRRVHRPHRPSLLAGRGGGRWLNEPSHHRRPRPPPLSRTPHNRRRAGAARDEQLQ